MEVPRNFYYSHRHSRVSSILWNRERCEGYKGIERRFISRKCFVSGTFLLFDDKTVVRRSSCAGHRCVSFPVVGQKRIDAEFLQDGCAIRADSNSGFDDPILARHRFNGPTINTSVIQGNKSMRPEHQTQVINMTFCTWGDDTKIKRSRSMRHLRNSIPFRCYVN